MKQIALVLVLMLTVATAAVSAEKADYQVAAATPYTATTVADADASGVDTNVALSGRVVRVMSDNKFLFTDGTGELVVLTDTKPLMNGEMKDAQVQVIGTIAETFMVTEVKAKAVVLR